MGGAQLKECLAHARASGRTGRNLQPGTPVPIKVGAAFAYGPKTGTLKLGSIAGAEERGPANAGVVPVPIVRLNRYIKTLLVEPRSEERAVSPAAMASPRPEIARVGFSRV